MSFSHLIASPLSNLSNVQRGCLGSWSEQKNDNFLPFLTRLQNERKIKMTSIYLAAPTHYRCPTYEALQQATMPPLPLAAATATVAYESSEDEERSLLFSDSDAEQEISQADDHNDTENDNLQWEDFMTRYWSNNIANNGNEFQIAVNADKILQMEDGDMMPHPLEPELDDMSHKSNNDNDDDDVIDMKNNDSMTLIKILSEVGLQSTLEMAKLHHHAGSTADRYSNHHSKSSKKKEAAEGTKSNSRTTTQLKKKKKQQLQDEFVIDMSNIPISVSKKKKKRANKAAIASSSSGGSMQNKNGQEISSSPGSSNTRGGSHPTKYSQSSALMQPASSPPQQQQEHEESLEDSLLAMAKRLSPGNDDNDIDNDNDDDQMIIPQQHHQISSSIQQQQPPNHPLSSTSIIPPPPPPPPINSSPLPNQNLIHQLGPIQTRTSLRSLLMKKWHHSWWMHYDTTSLLVFRSKDHLDDWVQNPYHGKREREYLVKLRVDFGDIVGATAAAGGGGASASHSSSGGAAGGGGVRAHQSQSSSGETNNKESNSNSILGHRILPIKQKSYHKNEPQMFQFKLERWTNMGVSVLAAFASEEEKEVQLLYDTILGIMEHCPFGGLHNIDHMLKH